VKKIEQEHQTHDSGYQAMDSDLPSLLVESPAKPAEPKKEEPQPAPPIIAEAPPKTAKARRLQIQAKILKAAGELGLEITFTELQTFTNIAFYISQEQAENQVHS
jgi:hypothetical protein